MTLPNTFLLFLCSTKVRILCGTKWCLRVAISAEFTIGRQLVDSLHTAAYSFRSKYNATKMCSDAEITLESNVKKHSVACTGDG
jgi:hypothetical protein